MDKDILEFTMNIWEYELNLKYQYPTYYKKFKEDMLIEEREDIEKIIKKVKIKWW